MGLTIHYSIAVPKDWSNKTVRAVSFAHARKKGAIAYPAVEPELLRVIIAD